MDAKDVLSFFMECCSERNENIRYNLASNAVLDWFGRTIRGHKDVEHFLRNEIWPQYEQNFATATTCEPIETRPTHEKTSVILNCI